MLNAAGDQRIWFQRVDQFRPPNWPGQGIPPPLHSEVMVDDLNAGEQAVLELGATRQNTTGDDEAGIRGTR